MDATAPGGAASCAAGAVTAGRARRYLVEGASFELQEDDIRRFPQSALSRQLDSIEDLADSFSEESIELPGRSAGFFQLLAGFLACASAPEQRPDGAYSAYRCVFRSGPEGADAEAPRSERNSEVTFLPARAESPAAPTCSFTVVGENSHSAPTFVAEFLEATVCSEVRVVLHGCSQAARLPALRIEGRSACGEWLTLQQESVVWREDAAGGARSARVFLQGAVPVRRFAVPEEWRDGGEREALYWRESDFYGIFELEMSMASLILDKLLKVYLTGSGPRVFKCWPSRDRHQLWATLWLSVRFVLDRPYSSAEVDWLVARHLLEPQAALATAVRAELLRRGFLRELPGGGSFGISRDAIQWVLDGDKLFRAHKFEAAVVAERPWWSLPLATQHILLAGGPLGGPPGPLVLERRHARGQEAEASGAQDRCLVEGHEFAFSEEDVQRLGQSELGKALSGGAEGSCPELPGQSAEFFRLLVVCLQATRAREAAAAYTRYRCVLLEPLEGKLGECGAGNTTVDFLPANGGAQEPEKHCVDLEEGPHRFVAFESVFPQSVVCSEVTVARVAGAAAQAEGAAAERLPPFRVDVFTEEGEWRSALCQPMPAQDEICNQGRGVARCFLPRAVPAQSFEVPGLWLEERRRAALRAGLELCQLDELEMAVGKLMLGQCLEASLCGDPPLLRQWPTKDRQQSWVTLWLALHFVPDRLYREIEVDWMITTHHVGVRVPDCPMIRKELERRGLMERRPGGGGCLLSRAGVRAAMRAAGVSPLAA